MRRELVVVAERAASQERDAHRLEIITGGKSVVQQRAGVRFRFLGAESVGAGALVERHILHEPDGLHAGKGAESVHKIQVKSRKSRPVVERFAIRGDLKGEDIACVVTGVHVRKLGEAAEQQAGGDQKHERQRRLGDDERVPAPVTPSRGPTARLAEPDQVGFGAANGGGKSAPERGEDGRPEREGQRASPEMNVTEPGNTLRCRPEKRRQDDGREGRGHHPGEERHHNGLGHLDADQGPPARPDGAADRKVPVPAVGADHEQVGHVGAGDQQHDGHRAQQNPERLPHGSK